MRLPRNAVRKMATLVLALLFSAGGLGAQEVDRALVLLAASSDSIDPAEFELQKAGYVDAFEDAAVWEAISRGKTGRIAATFAYWSSDFQQVVDWTVIDDFSASRGFASAIAASSRPFRGATLVGAAVRKGALLFGDLGGLGISTSRWVIDVSGDGCSPKAPDGKASAIRAGVDVINALAVGTRPRLLRCYEDDVRTENGFLLVAEEFDLVGGAIREKIVREVSAETPVATPEPSSAALLLAGAGMLGWVARHRRREGAARR